MPDYIIASCLLWNCVFDYPPLFLLSFPDNLSLVMALVEPVNLVDTATE